MTNGRDEDLFEGEFGPRKSPKRGGRSVVPDVSVTGGNKRTRAAWYTRQRPSCGGNDDHSPNLDDGADDERPHVACVGG